MQEAEVAAAKQVIVEQAIEGKSRRGLVQVAEVVSVVEVVSESVIVKQMMGGEADKDGGVQSCT